MITRQRVLDAATITIAAFVAGLLADRSLLVSIAIGGIVGVAWGAGRASGLIAARQHARGGER